MPGAILVAMHLLLASCLFLSFFFGIDPFIRPRGPSGVLFGGEDLVFSFSRDCNHCKHDLWPKPTYLDGSTSRMATMDTSKGQHAGHATLVAGPPKT